VILVSFDIDGTLETGDPAGPITLDTVRRALELGYVVGSASDRTVGFQRAMWAEAGIEVEFVGGKHHLPEVRARFSGRATRHIHIGDTSTDHHYAGIAGFEFYWVDQLPAAGSEEWIF
jgi:hydroxymethylpyrimidine pyrophosphatase-like HAD family hydrolase